MDGVGAIIITPTRELALQIFEVVRKVGVAHSLSCGLVIGGKDFTHERDRIANMNILVSTPGRLLQHMDETTGFDCSNLRLLGKFAPVFCSSISSISLLPSTLADLSFF